MHYLIERSGVTGNGAIHKRLHRWVHARIHSCWRQNFPSLAFPCFKRCRLWISRFGRPPSRVSPRSWSLTVRTHKNHNPFHKAVSTSTITQAHQPPSGHDAGRSFLPRRILDERTRSDYTLVEFSYSTVYRSSPL